MKNCDCGQPVDPQMSIFDPLPGGHHGDDPATSVSAAHDAQRMIRWGSQRHRLLAAFSHSGSGLTDEQAGIVAGVGAYNERRRCSELRKAGLIEATGETRPSTDGAMNMVCRITAAGRAALTAAKESAA